MKTYNNDFMKWLIATTTLLVLNILIFVYKLLFFLKLFEQLRPKEDFL